MDALRVKNLRSLDDTGLVPISPVTFLVGKNNSGKSTFLRSLPLLRQSVQADTIGPFLWYGQFVDFGGFRQSLRQGADTDTISFTFSFAFPSARTLAGRRLRMTPYAHPLHDLHCTLRLDVESDPQDDSLSRPQLVTLTLNEHTIRIRRGSGRGVSAFKVNDLSILDLGHDFEVTPTGRLVPLIDRSERDTVRVSEDRYRYSRRRPGLVESDLLRALQPLFHGNTKRSTILRVMEHIGIGASASMLEQLQQMTSPGKYWRRQVEGLTTDHHRFERIQNLVIANAAHELLFAADRYIASFAVGVRYIAPVRATVERYYRPQSLAVEEVDYEGRNLAMFLRSLSAAQRRDFRSWMQDNFGVFVTTDLRGGHLSLRIRDTESNRDFNLADVGFGFSQVLPVLAQLWAVKSGRRLGHSPRTAPITFAVEQPELHLHPRLQARLADLFLQAVKSAQEADIDLRLIIETHSQTLINQTGKRIQNGWLPSESVSVVLFEKEWGEPTSIRRAGYDKDGFLQNWPYGFFEPGDYRD